MPHARRLCRVRGQVQGRRRARRVEESFDRILVRRQPQRRPDLVVDLVMHHAGEFLARRNLHAHLEFQLPADLIQDIRHIVSLFGNVQLAVAEIARRGAQVFGALPPVEQRPDRDPRVHHIFAVIAGVVPAAADVERVGAAAARQAWDLLVALVRRDVDVARGTGPLRLARERHLDLDTAAILIEIRERLVLELAVEVVADVEGVADVRAHLQRVARAFLREGREVGDGNLLA